MIADGPPAEVLGGGWHFSTEVARVTGRRGLRAAGRGGSGSASRSRELAR